MHYYQHHIGDFLRDAGSLPNEYLGAYMRLLWRYYADESPITGELEDIAFDVSSTPEVVRQLFRKFFTQTPEGWRHKRCDAEIEQFHAKAEKARASAKSRWSNADASEKNANALPTHSERNANAPKNDANQEPITNNQHNTKIKSSRSAGADHSPEFARFWDEYPRKDARKKAAEIWRKRGLDQHADQIIENVKARKARDSQWQDPQYIPHATTYLGQERWRDPVQERSTSPPSRPQSKQGQGLMALAQFGGFIDGSATAGNHAGSRPALQLEPRRLPGVGHPGNDGINLADGDGNTRAVV